MAWDVFISVIFPCGDDKEPVMRLASSLLDGLPEDTDREVKRFLTAVSLGNGHNCGPKGALWSWGIVGNHTNGERFCEQLRPFWQAILGGHALDFEHINVFVEPEQSGAAQCFEIFREEKPESCSNSEKIIIKHHENLPFSWNQF